MNFEGEVETLNVQIDKIVYKKTMLHACKYATSDVIGIITGKIGKSYHIMDAYPLFHTRASLNMLEVALDLIQANLRDQAIIGVYESRAHPHGIMSELASELLSNMKHNPILLKVGHVEEDDKPKMLARVVSLKEEQRFVIEATSQLEWLVIADCLENGQHWQVIDFDAHFENVKLDFRNKFLE